MADNPQSQLLQRIEFDRHMSGIKNDPVYNQPDTHEILNRLGGMYAHIQDRYPTPAELREYATKLHRQLEAERFRLHSQMTVLESIMADTDE